MANGIPSGSAPLYLGSFASQRGAMAQKMTDRAIQLAEKEQTRQGKERAEMLKYFSYDTIKGLGRKMQDLRLNEINNMVDEFSSRWIKNGRKLTDQDYLDLQRRKNDIDQKFANMQSGVSNYWKIINEHTTGQNRLTNKSFEALRKWVDEGRIGEDPYFYVEYLPDTFASIGKNASYFKTLKPQKTTEIVGDKKVTTYTPFNIDDAVVGYMGAMSGNPEHEQLINNPEVRDEYLQNIRNVAKSYLPQQQPTIEPASKSEIEASRMKSMPLKYQEAANKYGWGELDKTEIRELSDAHEKVIGVIERDPAMINSLKGQYISGVGTVDRIELLPNGETIIAGAADKSGNRKSITIPPFVKGNRAQNLTAMESVLKILPGWTSTKVNKYSKYLNPDYEYNIESPEPPTAITELKNWLSTPGNEKSDYGEEARKDMVGWLEWIYPDEKIEVGSSWSKGKRPITIGDKPYNLAKEADRQKMMDDATAKAGINSISLQGAKTEKPAKDEATAENTETDYTIKIGAEDSIASRHNNPGNLVWANQPGAEKGEPKEGGGYWAKFKSPEEGFKGIERQIDLDAGRGLTLGEFISKYAPSSENNTSNYIANAEKELGITRDTKLSDVDTFDLASFIAKQESSTTVSSKKKEEKPRTVVQDGVTYTYNETTGQYE